MLTTLAAVAGAMPDAGDFYATAPSVAFGIDPGTRRAVTAYASHGVSLCWVIGVRRLVSQPVDAVTL
jgi:hypothetical protein